MYFYDLKCFIYFRTVGEFALDGVSHWDGIQKTNTTAPRDTVLLNIDRDWYFTKDRNFTSYPNDYWDTTIHAGLIHHNWKILTGDAGHGGFYKNKTVIPNPYPSVHLFDLDSDPYELVNLANYFPSVVINLLKMLKDFDDHSAPIDFPNYDEETVTQRCLRINSCHRERETSLFLATRVKRFSFGSCI